jgi:hypothetical protein
MLGCQGSWPTRAVITNDPITQDETSPAAKAA